MPDSHPVDVLYTGFFRRVARIFFLGGVEYLNNRDQIINVLNDTLC